MVDNIIVVDGKLSLKEDEDVKIVANNIIGLNVANNTVVAPAHSYPGTCGQVPLQQPKILSLDITNLEEETKAKLRGMMKFFSGDKNNIRIQVIDDGETKPCGTIYLTNEIQKQFEELMGVDRVKI